MPKQPAPHPLLIVPGLGGSGPDHWQSHWADRFDGAERVVQLDWDRPDFRLWLYHLRAHVERMPSVVLVGHSLGCILIVHLAKHFAEANIAGALLVAPADVENCLDLPDYLGEFRPIPREKLPFRSTLVASSNDSYMAVSRARAFADAWGSSFHDVGACGHINVTAGFGPWPEGEQILQSLNETIELDARRGRPAGIAAKRRLARKGSSTMEDRP